MLFSEVLILIIIFSVIFVIAAISGKISLFNDKLKTKRKFYIDNYIFSTVVRARVKFHYKHLKDYELDRVMNALRIYFLMALENKGKPLAMPSQVVDVAWHEFILCTRDYDLFCKQSFGKFLHHTPTERMNSPTEANKGIINAWKIACFIENIDSVSPKKLPEIFSIDTELNINDGFHYTLDCSESFGNEKTKYCATHIYNTSSSGCGTGYSCGSSCGGD